MKKNHYTSTGIAEELVVRAGLKKAAGVARMVRHYTNEGLLKTIGAVNTGIGRSRLYSEDEVVLAGVLLRLNRLKIPVGVMKELLFLLRRHLKIKHGGRSLFEVSRGMEKPCLFFTIPDESSQGTLGARIEEQSAFASAPVTVDAVVIQLARFLT